MKKITVLLLAILSFMTLQAADPDFAHPKTTLDAAIKHYDTAISSPATSTSGVTMIKSLLEIIGATAAIDQDSLVRVIPRIDRAIDTYSGADKALIITVKAELLNSIYSANRWTYDRMETPDEPLPDDITEWNGRQFCAQIQSLLSEAFDLAVENKNAKLADYKSVIEADRTSFIYFPSVASFVALKALNKNFNDDSDYSKDIINRMVSLSPEKSAPWFYWMVAKELSNHSFAIDEEDDYEDESDSEVSNPLHNLFLENRDCEQAGIVLSHIANNYFNYDAAPKWLIITLKDFIDKFPGYWQINELKNALNRLTRSTISLEINKIVSPNKPITIKVSQYFASNFGINIYKITESEFGRNNIKLQGKTPYKTLAVNNKTDIERADTTLTVDIDSPGYYMAVPIIDGSMSNATKAFFLCSAYYPILVSSITPNAFIITDLTNGSPLKGIAVTESNPKAKSKSSRFLGKSNNNGVLKFNEAVATKENRWQELEYTFSNGRTAMKFPNLDSSVYWTSDSKDRDEYLAELMLDKEIYHPGDTVNWAAIVTVGPRIGERRTAENVKMHLEFEDANRQTIDSINVVTDELGRVHGSFVAPETGLTGNYRIKIRTYEPPFDWIATRGVTVSDFKLPTFKIGDMTVSRDIPAKGDVTLKGNAITFSGMPVVGAKVEAEIWQASRWRWFSPSRKLGMLQTSTDDKGQFTVIVSDSLLNEAKGQCFVAKFTVTSLSGEACTESKSFTTGKPYFINITSHDLVNSDEPLIEPFEVYDADGINVDIELHWWLSSDDDNISSKDAIATGMCHTSKGYSIDLSNVASGVYYLNAAPVDKALADETRESEELIVYSLAKNTLPDNKPFILPNLKYFTDTNGKVEVTLGCAADDSYIYMVTGVGNQLRSIETLHLDRGFHKFPFALRDNEHNAELCFIAVRNGKVSKEMVEIERPDTRKLNLEGSAMRDKLSPGEHERWTLKLTDYKKEGVGGGLIATMFNAALNSIKPYDFPHYLFTRYPSTYIRITYSTNYIQVASVSKKLTTLKQPTLLMPEFNPRIDYSALVGSRIRIRGTMSRKAMYDDADEVEGIAYASDFTSALQNQVLGLAVTSGENSAEYDVEPEEGELYEVVADDADPAGSQLADQQDFNYRDSEVLQAFWMPELTFSSQGEAEISFTVPNANTTWAFNAFAWTADVRSARMVREFVASKPVMVQPNLPRFLRVGDNAQVLATVYNNSDAAAQITTVVEIFDIATGAVKSQFTSTDSVDAKASAIVSATVIADGEVSAIGYRVRSTLDRFSDGEQSFIPVIAATSDVIESENFYLNPGDATVEVKVPDGKKIKSTLDYTANPAWNIIKELPGLAAINSSTSIGASCQLFGSATAVGLLRSYPQLAEVLKAWSKDPDSKALTSRLEQNDELKAAVLNSTPWVQAAAGDTERMARLSLLFDRKTTEKSIQASIATLKKLQRADGGWSWGEWCKQSSMWSTNVVLQNLARLNDIGYLPADKDLKQMIERAIAYYESEIPKKEKVDYAFTYIVTMFPDVEVGLRGKQVINATIQHIVGNWKNSSTWYKAIEAIILDRNDHKSVARQIIASLSEFAVPSADKGTSFPSINNVNDYTDILYAFSRVTPDSKLIDGMRQWLVLRQQTTEQLGSVDPTRLIAAFAASGSDWFDVKADATAITLGGTPLAIGEGELATGHIVYNLPATAGGKKLSIDRGASAAVPAYGSVISRFTAESSKVKAQSCSDLSVEKRITALRDGRWQYVDDVQLGEQVRVLLTIKVKRDLEYVTVIDERPAAFEPVDQLPGWVWNGGAGFYRENRDSATNLFIDYLPKGTYQITIDMTASIAGDFTTGIATVQSQLAPSITAHSAGSLLHCK